MVAWSPYYFLTSSSNDSVDTYARMSAKAVSDSATDIEGNKEWKAYAFIGIVSFINFVSIADVLGVEDAREFFAIEKSKTVSLMFGIV